MSEKETSEENKEDIVEFKYKIKQISPTSFSVINGNGNEYTVWWDLRKNEFQCSCPFYVNRPRTCKHINMIVELLKENRISIDKEVII